MRPATSTVGRFTGALLLLAIVGCVHTENTTATAEEAGPPLESSSRLGPGDVVEIRVLGEPESGKYQVNADGTLDFPHIGKLSAAGRTAGELGKEIRDRLGADYLRDPQVTVLVESSQSLKITVLGEVEDPGTFDYRDQMTIVEAISLAGGFTPMASRNKTLVKRAGKSYRIEVERITDTSAENFYLRPGDTVQVPERIF